MSLTPQATLGSWLLHVLAENNGRASKWLALRMIEEAYGHLLTAEDRDLQPSVNECKWENRTAWERDKLVKAGLLQPAEQSGHGVWAITAAGRKVVEQGGRTPRRGPRPGRVSSERRAGDGSRVAIHGDYEGRRTKAWFSPSTQRVEIAEGPLAGASYKSPSGAARAVVAHGNPEVNPSRNGWAFWTVTATGAPLQSLR
jgi:hypothetical protein